MASLSNPVGQMRKLSCRGVKCLAQVHSLSVVAWNSNLALSMPLIPVPSLLLGSFEKSGPVVSSAAGPWNQQRAVLMVSAAQHGDRTGRWDWLLPFPSLSFQRELGRGNFWTISQAPTLLCFSPGHRYYFFLALHCERWIAFMGLLSNLPVSTLVACNIAAPATLATGLAM